MRSILDRASITATPAPAPAEKPKYVPKPFKKAEDPAQISAFEEPAIEEAPAPVQPTATVPSVSASAPAQEPAPAEEKKNNSKGKSHIGNMFDLLTFSDV